MKATIFFFLFFSLTIFVNSCGTPIECWVYTVKETDIEYVEATGYRNDFYTVWVQDPRYDSRAYQHILMKQGDGGFREFCPRYDEVDGHWYEIIMYYGNGFLFDEPLNPIGIELLIYQSKTSLI